MDKKNHAQPASRQTPIPAKAPASPVAAKPPAAAAPVKQPSLPPAAKATPPPAALPVAKALPAKAPPSTPALDEGAQIDFAAGWEHSVRGELVAGKKVTLNYDARRLGTLASDVGAGSLTAYSEFKPGGHIDSGWVVHVAAPKGQAAVIRQLQPVTFAIPEGSVEMQVWFRWSGGSGAHPAGYDSNFGRNYRFPVKRQA
jgi:hypothetical protein